MDKLPKFIRAKLRSIEQHNMDIYRLRNQIEKWKPALEDALTGRNCWQWWMYFWNGEEDVIAELMEEKILEALNGCDKK